MDCVDGLFNLMVSGLCEIELEGEVWSLLYHEI
jgi:hypothetical protein